MNKKKNLFFKKRESKDMLISKRISIVLRKRKKLKNFKTKKIDKGNFFLKKFFYKTLLKNRKFFKKLFLFSASVKQTKITKRIKRFSSNINNKSNTILEYSLCNLLLRSGLFFFQKDVLLFIKFGMVYLNGRTVYDSNINLVVGDIIQLSVSTFIYKYIYFSKKLLKRKVALFRYTTWKFFKKKLFKKKQGLRSKKRKNPKYLYLFCNFKLNTPSFLEVDFLTISISLLRLQNTNIQSSYYLNKTFSYKLFPLYNFKKIN